MSTKKTLLLGIGIGAVLGILYAPHKGSKTRKLISRRGLELRDGWENLKITVSSIFEKAEDASNDFIEDPSAKTSFANGSLQDQWNS